ncbi:50S ribosomal protein L25/general stress protein Ctc [Roseospirillum parvum]|uniref:Large ribosomal subunit protein bL25 n=1 Tax=Roseospirillum parvum TaxID=83401 RepID=A0A1G7ZFL3_9PROT|nr:50S ribosomal protein L25/general stress protein Ctc [Roseospirillum parvum]SDH07429.1 large subunit ribosomal protein L25 [Roseospirillum parvum]
MSKDVSKLPVQERDRAGKGAARATRREGLVPGVIYGDKKPPQLISMEPKYLIAAMHRPGFNTQVFELDLAGKKHRVMAQDVQMHPVTDQPIHIDFLRIGADTEVTVHVPVHFLNEDQSPGIKRGGVLNVVRHEVVMIGKPANLPEQLEVDLTGLDVNETIHFSAITVPDGVRPEITDRDFTIATIAAPSGMKSEAADDVEAEDEE